MAIKLPNRLTVAVARQVLTVKKHSPTILFGAGVVGVVATTVSAARATLKLEDVLEESQKNIYLAKTLESDKYSEQDRKKDLALIYFQSGLKVARLYLPTFVLGSLSIAALTGSHHILKSRNAALTAAYAAVDKGFKEYRARVIEDLGEDKDREYMHGTETKTVVDDKGKEKQIKVASKNSTSPYARIWDDTNQNWNHNPEYNVAFLRLKQMELNDTLKAKGHVFLNEVFDELGLERTKAGQVVGWVWNKGTGDDFIDFGIWDDKSMARFHEFVTGQEKAILLDFNVDGNILDLF